MDLLNDKLQHTHTHTHTHFYFCMHADTTMQMPISLSISLVVSIPPPSHRRRQVKRVRVWRGCLAARGSGLQAHEGVGRRAVSVYTDSRLPRGPGASYERLALPVRPRG